MKVPIAAAVWSAALAWAAAAQAQTQDNAPRYTFSWLIEGSALKPRGGTTKGVPVTVDTAESPAWKSLQEKDLTTLERDRRAILAMSGTYRVTFDFLETVPFAAGAKPRAPYQSWGTEKVYVDRDEPRFISLVHILEMHILMPDGKVGEPMVTKHWRQDWVYEPKHMVEYKGSIAGSVAPCRRRSRVAPGRSPCTRWMNRRATRASDAGSTAPASRPGSPATPGVRCRGANGACARTTRCWRERTATPSSRPAGSRKRTI